MDARLWRFRGTPHYLGQQATRLGVTPVLADRAATIRKSTGFPFCWRSLRALAQGPQKDGRRSSAWPSSIRSRGRCRKPSRNAKLHALAATAATMIDEAYKAFNWNNRRATSRCSPTSRRRPPYRPATERSAYYTNTHRLNPCPTLHRRSSRPGRRSHNSRPAAPRGTSSC